MSTLLEQASLVLIPSGYKEDVVYSEIPTNGSGDMTFTRASDGTRINSAGLVENCPWNLMQYSEDFSTSPWNVYSQGTGVSPVITANDTTAPNGTLTADKIVFNTGSGTSAGDISTIYQSISNQPIGVYTASIYGKVATGTAKILIRHAGGGTYTTLNLTTEWQRFEIAETNITSGVITFEIGLRRGLSNEPISSPVTCYLWGAQLNIGSTAKPYFPTTNRQDVPRLTYQNGGGGCPSLLLEKQSTNYALSSEDFTNTTYWTVSGNMTVTANQAISPDGTQNADLFYNDGARYNFLATPVGVYYSISCYFKRVTANEVQITCSDGATGDMYGNFNLVNLTSSSTSSGDWSNISTKIESVGNGWYRCIITGLRGSTGSVIGYRIECGESAKSFYAWGYQAEASSYATSYIPTQGSSVTRLADECYKTGISSLIGQTEGVLFIDMIWTNYGNVPTWIAFLGSGIQYIGLYTDSNFKFVAEVYNNSPQFKDNTYSFVIGQRYKLALAYKANDFAFYVNGTQVSTDFSGTVPTTADFNFNYNLTNDNLGTKLYNQAILFPNRLTNAELASLTTL